MADNVEIQGLEFQIQANGKEASKSLDALAATLSKLKAATSSGTAGMKRVTTQISALSDAIKGINSGKASALQNIAAGVSSLSSAGKISSSIPNQLSALGAAVSKISPDDAAKLTALGEALKPIGELSRAKLTSYTNQLAALPEVIKELDAADISKFTQQMRELHTAMAPFANDMAQVSAGFSAFPSKIQKVIASSATYNAAMNKSAESTKKLGTAVKTIKFGALFASLKKVGGGISDLIDSSSEYQEDLNLFMASMGEYGGEAKEYADEVANVMGIDPAVWMRNQGVFQTLITGFGDTADRAYTMSKNLTQLGYDISSFFNISVDDAMQKLQSGISGELEPLRRLGYDLSAARLQQEAYALGIGKTVNEMTQAEKAELRYHAIMTQVTTAQGDMARTLDAPANQLRIFRAEITQAGRAIGNIFIPMLNKALPYAIAFLQVIRDLSNALAELFGFALTDVDWDSASSGAYDTADGLEAAADAAKEFKRYTMGFDELNILPSQSSSSSESSYSGSGFDFELPEYDFLANVTETKSSIIKAWIEANAAGIIDAGGLVFLAIGALLAFSGANIPVGIGLMAAGASALPVGIAMDPSAFLAVINGAAENFDVLAPAIALVVGAVLAFSGANLPIGIALLAFGAVSVVSKKLLNWDAIPDNVKTVIAGVTTALYAAALAVGAILAFAVPSMAGLGLALMAVGAVGIATQIAPNWNTMSDAVKKVINTILLIAGGAMLAIGIVLGLSGVNIPLGLALASLGAATLVTAADLNWNTVTSFVKTAVSAITAIVSGASVVLGVLLCLSGAGIGLGLALIAAGVAGSVAAWKLDDNPVTRFVKKLANGVIGIVNVIIDAVNELFHLNFSGLKIGGVQVIPAFNARLLNIPKIPKFEYGGFPDKGQLFIAREAGAEMVGSIGRKAAVANNDQIVESVSDGVYRAAKEALGGGSRNITLVVQMDGKEVYRQVVDENNRVVRTTGKSPLLV